MPADNRRIETRLIHAGEPRPRIAGAVAMPIFQSSTFVYEGEASYHDVRYIRLNNTPNHVALHAKLAALEGGEAALVTASGMAAISTTLLSLLATGDHILVQRCLYGGTHDFVTKDLPRLGISCSFIDADDPPSWRAHLRERTKVIYVETLSNPLLEMGDLEAVVAFARAHGLVSVIDNTFATPIAFQPLEHGFDLSVHSCTKYLNGHSDIVAGAVIGSAARVADVKHQLDHLGGALDPHACALLHRGMKTLALRVRWQSSTALALARFLAKHPAVARVHYPGLETHPQHERAAASLGATFGGVMSFELHGDVAAADRLIAALEYAICAPSLGGPETLITRPATTSHAGLATDERRQLGIADGLIRLSIGLEAPDDLIRDFEQALGRVAG
jgi:cystathionine beta-lyase/cystathionine gamma-synthase